MKIIEMNADMLALTIKQENKVLEDIFTDESMMNEVNPIDYYGLTPDQVDIFLYHTYYNETYGGLLSRKLRKTFADFGREATELTKERVLAEYKREWAHVRKEHGLL